MINYYWRWLKKAAFESIGGADLLSGLAGAILGVMAHYLPQQQTLIDKLLWQIPLWAFGAVILVRIIIAPYLLAKEDANRIKALELNSQTENLRVALSKLRTTGVALRNEAKDNFDNDKEWRIWEREAIRWNNEVINTVSTSSIADAEWYSTLDVVPKPRIDMAMAFEDDDDRYHLYSMHDFRLLKLETLINKQPPH